MQAPNTRLFALIAADLMSRPVESIPRDMPLQDAARRLSKAGVSGAPVVDGSGRCVGVLSASDFVHWAERGAHADKVHCTVPSACSSDWQVMELEFLPRDEVRWHMTPDPVTVEQDAPLAQLAQTMVDAHIHRLIVVDEAHRPVGVVSSIDILAAVARTARLVEPAECGHQAIVGGR
jgi:CBS domain-containing protein